MSTEYYIVCRKCQDALWAGCDGMGGWQFLYANRQEMKALGEFLATHQMHPLAYLPEQLVDDAGYKIRHAGDSPPTPGGIHKETT